MSSLSKSESSRITSFRFSFLFHKTLGFSVDWFCSYLSCEFEAFKVNQCNNPGFAHEISYSRFITKIHVNMLFSLWSSFPITHKTNSKLLTHYFCVTLNGLLKIFKSLLVNLSHDIYEMHIYSKIWELAMFLQLF